MVKTFKERSIFWSKIWKDAGCPINNELDRCRKYARLQYHKSIKFIKHNKERLISNNISNSLCNKNFTEFWKEIKKIKGINRTYPAVVDNKSSESEINKIFFDKYNKLYNSYNDRDSFEQYITNNNFNNINNCSNGICKHSHNINEKSVINAIEKLKTSKNDYVYGLSSDYFINGNKKLYKILSILFNLMLSHGITNLKFNSSIIKPFPKDTKKSISYSNNYRAIAISTIFSKIFEYIIIEKALNFFDVNNCQFGYKENLSTNLCSFVTIQTIEYYKNKNSNIHVLFLDASKAFDLVKYDKLFDCLKKQNICSLIMRILLLMYKYNNLSIEWGNTISNTIYMSNGVKQGGILSPLLFNIYLMPLFNSIQKSSIGCYMGNLPANIFGYADDIVILAPTIYALKKLILLCEQYSDIYNLKFNTEKSKLMSFFNERLKINVKNINVRLNGIKIENVTSYKHLGVEMVNKNFLIDYNSIIKDMKVKSNIIMREFSYQTTQTRIKLFNTHCMSLYGCVLWDLQGKDINNVEVAWRKCARYVLGLPPRTHNILIPSLLKCNDILSIIQNRIINFCTRGLKHQNEFIKFIFNQCIIENFSYFKKNINIIINNFNLTYNDLVKIKHFNLEGMKGETWKPNILTELLKMRDERSFKLLTPQEVDFMIFTLCTG